MRIFLGLTVLSLLVAQEPANQPAQAGPKTDPASPAAVSPASGPGKPAAVRTKQNGLARQRASLRRQVGNPDEIGWFFWPWPELGNGAKQEDPPPPASDPAPAPVPAQPTP